MADLTLTVSPSGVTPQGASSAYAKVTSGVVAGDSTTNAMDSFGATLSRAMEGAVQAGHDADTKTAQAVSGSGSLTDVVAAVTQAELTLQTTVAIRDRVVAAYQQIMQMPI